MKILTKSLWIIIVAFFLFALAGCRQESEQDKKIRELIELINQLPAEITLQDEVQVNVANDIFEALDQEAKTKVTNKQMLLNAVLTLLLLQEEHANHLANQEAALAVDQLIEGIPNNLQYEDAETIIAARNAYELLTSNQQTLVTKLSLLVQKESEIEVVINVTKSSLVEEAIRLIPAVLTKEDIELVLSAREAYNELTSNQKTLVTNLALLITAEAYVATLDDREIASEWAMLVHSLPEIITTNEKELLEHIQTAYNLLTTLQKTFINPEVISVFEGAKVEYKIASIKEWATNYVGTRILDRVVFLKNDPIYGLELQWDVSDDYAMDDEGYAYPENVEQPLDIFIRFTIDNQEIELIIPTVIATFEESNMYFWFNNQFERDLIARDYNVLTVNPHMPKYSVSWHSTNTDVFTNEGKLVKPYLDTPFHIVFTIHNNETGVSQTFHRQLIAMGMSIGEIGDVIEQWIYDNVGTNGTISTDVELPTWFEDFQLTLSWESTDPAVLTNDGIYTNPGIDTLISLLVRLQTPRGNGIIELRYKVVGEEYDDIWDAVEFLLQMIHKDEISNQRFTMYGVGRNDISHNYGYIPFYRTIESNVIDGILPLTRFNRPGTKLDQIKYVTIHDTANVNAGAAAHNNFIHTTTSSVSWHYTIDDLFIYQHIPDDEVAWHAGTSYGNRNSIGIETCINLGVDYNEVMRKTAKLTAELLHRHNLTVNEIRQHFDFSGKNCPQVMREANRWNEFLNLCKIEYFAQKYMSDVSFVWESLSPSMLDNEGRVINHPNQETEVRYQVAVTVNGETRNYTFTSTLQRLSF